MTKRILDVGNCDPDHSMITDLFHSNFGPVEIDRAHGISDALDFMRSNPYDLVVINRLMDRTGAPGLDIIQQIKADAAISDTPVMMITNFEEHQQLAMQSGAVMGFGKAELNSPVTVDRLRPFLA